MKSKSVAANRVEKKSCVWKKGKQPTKTYTQNNNIINVGLLLGILVSIRNKT